MAGIIFNLEEKSSMFFVRYMVLFLFSSFSYAGFIALMKYVGFFNGHGALEVIRATYQFHVIIFLLVIMSVFAWELKVDCERYENDLEESCGL